MPVRISKLSQHPETTEESERRQEKHWERVKQDQEILERIRQRIDEWHR